MRFAALAFLVLAFALPTRAQTPTPSVLSVVHRIVERAASTSDLDALLAMLAEDSIPATRTSATSLSATPMRPLRARDVARVLGMTRGCILSTDVHQATWSLFDCAPSGDSDDRMAFRAIGSGVWDVVPRVSHRPPGRLPTETAGASPSYDVTRYRAEVTSIEVRLRR